MHNWKQCRPLEQDKEMREVMSVLDKDGAGFINVVELRSILQVSTSLVC